MNGTRISLCTAVSLLSAGLCSALNADVLPQPGPEDAGLRLRFVVEGQQMDSGDRFNIRLDLINVMDKPVTFTADWPDGVKGSFRDYVERAASIRTHPDIVLWGLQVRRSPQPARTVYSLQANETLSVEWTSKNRRLKSRHIYPNTNRNPYFPSDGLYSVHAELQLEVETASKDNEREGTDESATEAGRRRVLLRSNEQLVSVGGSKRAPKTAIATIQNLAEDSQTGRSQWARYTEFNRVTSSWLELACRPSGGSR